MVQMELAGTGTVILTYVNMPQSSKLCGISIEIIRQANVTKQSQK
jgi:hypothetical protein